MSVHAVQARRLSVLAGGVLVAALCVATPARADTVAQFTGAVHLDGVGPIALPAGFDTRATETFSVAVADVSADGKPDALAVECAPTNAPQICALAVHLGNGDGTFGPPVITPTVGLWQVAPGDFNHDARADVAAIVAIYNPSTGHVGASALQILLSNGDGHFTPAGSAPASPAGATSFSTPQVRVADVDEDGNPDVLLDADLTGNGTGQVSLFHVDGSGALSTAQPVIGQRVGLQQVGDFNRDGHLDLLTNGVQVLLGDGRGAFQSYFPPLPTYQTGRVAAGDFNQDGFADLAYVLGTPGHDFLVYHGGSPTGTWGNPVVRIPVNGAASGPMMAADLNGDGRADAVSVNGVEQVQAFLNLPGGWIATAAVAGPAPMSVLSAVLADVSGHGDYAVFIGPNATGAGIDVYPPAIPVDTVAPTVTGTADRAANPAGWYRAPVAVSWTATDPDPSSGSPTVPPPTVLVTEGAGLTATSMPSCDPDGNCRSGSFGPVNVDLTPPVIAASVSQAPNQAGWNNGPVTVMFACSDALSGVATCPQPETFSGEAANQEVTVEATDRAGNSATATVIVSLDRTAPELSATIDASNDHNWFNTPVTVGFHCEDTLSGVASCSAQTVLTGDGRQQQVTGVGVDRAGNTATKPITGINIDRTAPVVTIGGITDGATYPIGQIPTATCTAEDALSGVDGGCAVSTTGGNPDGTGIYTVTATATDLAGNTGTVVSTFTVHASAPAAPAIASVSVGDHRATITWLKPADGGSVILGYTVTATPGGQSCSTTSADELTCTITGLTNGVNYTFTVTARNAAGTSPPPPAGGGGGAGTGTGTPGTPPPPVGGVQPTLGADGTQVTLHWLAAASDLPITGYRATAEPGGRFCTTNGALSCTITGLTPGQDYTFTVVAINGAGPSDPSPPVSLQPAVTAVSPDHGPVTGGTVVTITGTHLTGATAVTFGDLNATGFTVQSDTSITATAPAAVSGAGAVDVRVSTPAGTSTATAADRFTFEPAADLAVSVAASANPVALGDAFTETVTVTNHGPSAATQAAVTISFTAAAARPLSAVSTAGTCTIAGTTVTCTAGTMATAATATVTITVEPQATGTVTITATAQAHETDPAAADNTASQSVAVTNGHGCTLIGTPGADTITGTNADDVICALGGDDTITGGSGDDIIYGGSGNDYLDGGNGNDIIYSGETGSTLVGGNGNDTIVGGAGNDTIYGGNGDDTIDAGAGNDTVYGGNGNDTIDAGVGTDSTDGGNGNDICPHTETATSCTA